MTAPVALVADALTTRGGGEKVFAVMCEAFPDADVYTSIYTPESTLEEFGRRQVRELVTARFLHNRERLLRWYPLAAFQMGRTSFDGHRVILSSAAHLARYIRKGRAVHISYCYYPFRLLYEPQRYPQVRGLRRALMRAALPALRHWDLSRARTVDRFIGISELSRAAIRRYYGREADVIPSPVLSVPDAYEPRAREDFYLLVSRLERWKMVDVVVDAFALLDARLVIVGDGPERGSLERRAGPNVSFVGSVSEAELVEYYRRAQALVHAANTEYGLTPIEANAQGTPAICWGVGGVWETMVPYSADSKDATALFFDQLTPECLADAVRRFGTLRFDGARCFANARRFSRTEFIRRITEYVRRHA